jgi:hypothetical protein
VLNDTEVARSLMDKARFQALALQRGVPGPHVACPWEGEGDNSLRGFRNPCS